MIVPQGHVTTASKPSPRFDDAVSGTEAHGSSDRIVFQNPFGALDASEAAPAKSQPHKVRQHGPNTPVLCGRHCNQVVPTVASSNSFDALCD